LALKGENRPAPLCLGMAPSRIVMSSQKNMPRKNREPDLENAVVVPHASGELAADIRAFIEAARLKVAQTVNAELVLLNWQIGNRIRRDILQEARAEYGDQIVSTLSRQLTIEIPQ
jgi:hypothetical protein